MGCKAQDEGGRVAQLPGVINGHAKQTCGITRYREHKQQGTGNADLPGK